jgi:hypothetical protein
LLPTALRAESRGISPQTEKGFPQCNPETQRRAETDGERLRKERALSTKEAMSYLRTAIAQNRTEHLSNFFPLAEQLFLKGVGR